MIKKCIRNLFFKFYRLNYGNFKRPSSYNRYGMVIPKSNRGSIRYIVTPVSINRKNFRNSMLRYGITTQDSGETAIMKAILVHLDDISKEQDQQNNTSVMQSQLVQNVSK